MKTKFVIQKLGLLIAMLLAVFPAFAYDFAVGGIYYNILPDKLSVEVTYKNTNYDTYIGDIAIPAEVSYDGKTYTVTSIGNRAFYKCSTVTSITIPATINSIGLYAFEDANHIQKVNISNLTAWCMIDVDSFYSCPLVYGGVLYLDNEPLSSLETLESSCTTIAKYAFYGNTYLTNVVLPNSITTVQEGAFSGCSKLKYLEVGPNVISMGEGAFKGCSSLRTIKFSDSNQKLTLGRYAYGKIYKYFKDCPLTSVYIGREVSWEDTDLNYQYYYPFTTVTTAILNSEKVEGDHGFSNSLRTVYVGPKCNKVSIRSTQLTDLYLFTNDITYAYLGSNKSNIYVMDKLNIPDQIASLTYKTAYNLVELINLQGGASYEYGEFPAIGNDNIKNNVLDMTLDVSKLQLDSTVGHHESGIGVVLYNDLWNVQIDLPYSYSVTPAALTVIANDASRKYGSENPELSCSFFGFKNGETKDVLTRLPNVETTATVSSNVGTYPIIPSGAQAQNYSFNYERGTLTITKADQTINWSQTFNSVKVGDVIELTAISSADLPIKYTSSDEAVAEIFTQGSKKYVEFLKPGNVSLRATQDGNENYKEAERVSKTITVNPVEATILSISATNMSLLVGQTEKLTVKVEPDNTTDKTITWKSDNEAVATVSSDGTVTAVSVGTANITATCGKATATCKVTVNPVEATGVILSADNMSLFVGQTEKLTVTVQPDNATDKTVTWRSDNEAVATVSSDGTVTAVSVGTANITATCGKATTTCKVTVNPVEATGVILSADNMSLLVGQSEKLTATVEPDNTTDKTITWKSDNEAVATVSSDGTVTAVSVGIANITATCGKATATCKVTVNPVEASGVILSADNMSLLVGQTEKLTVTVEPDNTTDKTVTWKSDNEAVATVSSDGTVTAVSVGTANITATCGKATATCKVTVNPILIESITISPEFISEKEGQRIQLTVTILPEDATDKSLEWSSSDESVASVSQSGIVQIHKIGYARITATAKDGSGVYGTCDVEGQSEIESILINNDVKWDLYDMQGILVKSELSKNDIRHILPGFYILRSGNKVLKVKL